VEKTIDQICADALREIETAKSKESLNAVSLKYLSRKGIVTLFLRSISQLPSEERPKAGGKANETKRILEKAVEDAINSLDAREPDADSFIDISLPGRSALPGSLHPITQITRQICDIFTRMGFEIAEGPEVESDYYNFEALNIPKYHPARDMQDTFYVSDNIVLRTHTSPIQVRVMENANLR